MRAAKTGLKSSENEFGDNNKIPKLTKEVGEKEVSAEITWDKKRDLNPVNDMVELMLWANFGTQCKEVIWRAKREENLSTGNK